MVEVTEITLGQYLPDQPSFNNPGCIEALNAYPGPSGFDMLEGPVTNGDTFSQVSQGAASFIRTDETAMIVVGGDTALAVQDGGGVTETTGLNAIGEEGRWRFERFNQILIAVAPGNSPKHLPDIDVDLSFTDLPGSPPTAEVIGRVDNFLVLGNIAGEPYRVQWSNFNDPTGTWDTNVGDLSGFQDLDARYGPVTGIVTISANSGLVFQERAIWLMTFVGAPLAFNFAPVTTDYGCPAPDSIVSVGSNVYFFSQDGFYFTNGAEIARVGANRVDKTFLENYNETYQSLVQGALNKEKQCIVWSYNTNSPQLYQNQFIYSFVSDGWARAAVDCYTLVEGKQNDLTLDDLTTLYGTIENMPFPIGSSNYKGKAQFLSGLVDDGEGGSDFVGFTGDALEATFETGRRQLIPGSRTTVTGMAPIVQNLDENTTTQVVSQDNLTSVTRVTPATEAGADGFCPHHVNGRYVSGRMIFPAAAVWSRALGMQARVRAAGRR